MSAGTSTLEVVLEATEDSTREFFYTQNCHELPFELQ